MASALGENATTPQGLVSPATSNHAILRSKAPRPRVLLASVCQRGPQAVWTRETGKMRKNKEKYECNPIELSSWKVLEGKMPKASEDCGFCEWAANFQ